VESILQETLKGRLDEDGFPDDDVPTLPPMAYKSVKALMRLLPTLHDGFSYELRTIKQIADSIGIEESPDKSDPESRAKKPMECELLRVEADTWYSLGKCLLNAFSKLYLNFGCVLIVAAQNISFVRVLRSHLSRKKDKIPQVQHQNQQPKPRAMSNRV
jgi:hypothetical protein